MKQEKAEDNTTSCWKCGLPTESHGKERQGLTNIGLRCSARNEYYPQDPPESRLSYQGTWYQPRDLPEHIDVQWSRYQE
jgi:hypothetical protein